MSFLDPTTASWASIAGTASIISNADIVNKYYTPALRTWLGDLGDGVHDGSPSDPRVGLIKLEAQLATYVLPKRGIIGKAAEHVKGAVTGDVPDNNTLREISSSDLAECE